MSGIAPAVSAYAAAQKSGIRDLTMEVATDFIDGSMQRHIVGVNFSPNAKVGGFVQASVELQPGVVASKVGGELVANPAERKAAQGVRHALMGSNYIQRAVPFDDAPVTHGGSRLSFTTGDNHRWMVRQPADTPTHPDDVKMEPFLEEWSIKADADAAYDRNLPPHTDLA